MQDEPKSPEGRLPIALASAAAGLALGVLAGYGRRVAVQAPTALAGDWVEGLAAEHEKVRKLLAELEATTSDDRARRTALVKKLKFALTKHALQEENVIYPALVDAGEEAAAEELTREHGQLKHILYRFDIIDPDAPGFLPLVGELRDAILPHMEEEELELFPRLRNQLNDDGNDALKMKMNREGLAVA